MRSHLRPSGPRARPSLVSPLTALVVAGLAFAPASVEAQPRPTRPDVASTYAIVDARIVTVSGQTLERGTVLIRDGLIAEVGPNVEVPAGAWVVDGSGKVVYPGLFDALTTLGHPSDEGQGERPHSWGAQDRPGTTSWLSGAEDLSESDGRFGVWRDAGVTTVLSTRGSGLVTGQAAVLDLVDFERPREMVVATPVAMRLNLSSDTYSGYPGSLMGRFAYFKQLYLDAAHYGASWDAYAVDPRGLSRPEWDATLEPIRRQLQEGWPVLFPADDRIEIERAIRTSDEMGVRPVIYGAQGGYDAASLLSGRDLPVLVNVDWPEPPSGGDPDDVPDLADLRMWDRASTTPGVLAASGVRFAFHSGGDDPGALVDGVRRAVAHGLSEADAIRALTLSPAEIFGVADRLGSVEAGKIANVVVASGDLFEPGTRIETVFVDGARFDVTRAVVASDETEQRDEESTTASPVAMATLDGPYRSDPVTFIDGATLLTASNGTIEDGDILIRDGRIAEVGTGLTAPSGARVVDGTGLYVTPGIIDAHSHLAAASINEGSVNVSSMVGIRDVLDPSDVGLYWALAGGVTTINILHGSANPIGGKNAVIKLRWGADGEEMLFAGAMPGIKFALGENPKRDRDPDRYPASRMGVIDVIRQAFIDAEAYAAAWGAWESGGRSGVPPRRDLELETLAEVLSGERWVHAHSYRADEILQLLRVAEEFDVTIRTLQHVLEGYKVADEIAQHGAGASTFSDWWAYKVEAYDAIPHNAALMAERGVLTSINSDSGEEIRHLNQEAAKAVKWGGIEEEEALRLVTLNPAIQLGIDDRVGSIEVGKDADLAVFDGHPLSMLSKVVQTYVDGALYFDIELDRERQTALENEKRMLMEKHGLGVPPTYTDASRGGGR
ncbi:MAG: amidohydrolase family protein [Gemmatimonadota bacterium]